jgi:predicted Zn-dependent protease
LFVYTGLISLADNEAQLAGVLAHEMSHIRLRHGTNQASKASGCECNRDAKRKRDSRAASREGARQLQLTNRRLEQEYVVQLTL